MSSECAIEDIKKGSSESEDNGKKIVDDMKKFVDEIFLFQNKYDLPQIINSNLMDVFADVTKTVNFFLMDGRRNDIHKHIEQLKAYSCVTMCLTFTKTFAYHVQHLLENVKKQRDDINTGRVNKKLENVTAILCSCSKRIEGMGKLVKKILHQGNDSQDGNLIEFGLLFDILVIDLDYCASDLIHAKDQLPKLFSAKRGYFTWWGTRAGSTSMSAVAIPAVGIVHFMALLLPMIGTYCSIGAVGAESAVDLHILGYMMCEVAENSDFEIDIQKQFRVLDLGEDSLHKILSNLKWQSETTGNAKKLQDAKEENKLLQEKLAALKEQKLAHCYSNTV